MEGFNFTNVAVVILLLHLATFTSCKEDSVTWKTLDGSTPLVIARGGFSGLFPYSSTGAYNTAMGTSVSDLVLWCDVQLTKDGAALCLPSILLNKCTNIQQVHLNGEQNYTIDGVQTKGYFSIDYTFDQLQSVTLTQGNEARPTNFDNRWEIITVEEVYSQYKPAGYWLNIQNVSFYSQHKLSMRTFALNVSKNVTISHLSSPDFRFLQELKRPFASTKTKLIFQFLDKDMKETSTNLTYGSLLNNLTYIKSFASGILVPKTYIWPVDANSYLGPHTSLVVDAHKNGLEVFAANFANDNSIAYNYSYNPVAEYVSFIDNSDFSVDGVLSDFPVTLSAARECFAHVPNNASTQEKPLIISHFGSSGNYPSCTDISYTAAISDGADIIDCPVQMSKEGLPFCLTSANLMDSTTVAQTQFQSMLKTVNEIQSNPGIFSFDLNWTDIQGLTPVISNPFANDYFMHRNLKFQAGKLVSLSQFLDLAKNASSLSGVLIKIENAKYLAQSKSMGVIDAVLDALEKADYNSATAKKVMIQSTNSSVLKALKGKKYELVYEVDKTIRGVTDATIRDIKTFSDSVVVNKKSVYPQNAGFVLSESDVVHQLQSFNLSVYVEVLKNEFVDIAFDFFADANAEINSFVLAAGVDGLVTEFPQTAASYKKNRCLSMKEIPVYMSPGEPGGLINLTLEESMPPAMAPNPLLNVADVSEAPLPPVTAETPQRSPNGHNQVTASALLSSLAILVPVLLLLRVV